MRTKPNWRERVKNTDFPPKTRSRSQAGGFNTLASGYVMNSTLFDGSGWEATQVARNQTNQFRGTEYRTRYNPEKKFHKAEVPKSSGKLPRKSLVYEN